MRQGVVKPALNLDRFREEFSQLEVLRDSNIIGLTEL